MDRIGPIWPKWTEVDWIRPNGPNLTLVDRMDYIGPKRRE